jgi:3-deoxy-manno-octulosonate cytidylyltransferase (CMP-KDO synthetase)
MVVFDRNHKALYFSKNLIPFVRDPLLQKDVTDLPLYQHIGLYAYRWAMLKRYVQLPPSRLEQLEGLEQLRALENGIPIHVVPVDYRGRTHASIDSPEDVQSVERILAKEGEGI